MTAMPGRCVVINGGRRNVVVTASGATVVGEEALSWLLRTMDTSDAARLHRPPAPQPEVEPLVAARTTAQLLDSGVIDDEGVLPKLQTTVVGVTWDAFSMLPRQVARLARAVVANGLRVVVEFGSGASTLGLTAALYVMNEVGTLVSFEQDAVWIRRVEQPLAMFRRPGLDARTFHCPLTSWPGGSSPPVTRWYDATIVNDVLHELPGPVDLLVVDGPTAFRPEWRFDRYPALPVVRPFLSDSATIMLDDTHRAHERDVLELWQQELGPDWSANVGERATWLTRVRH